MAAGAFVMGFQPYQGAKTGMIDELTRPSNENESTIGSNLKQTSA